MNKLNFTADGDDHNVTFKITIEYSKTKFDILFSLYRSPISCGIWEMDNIEYFLRVCRFEDFSDSELSDIVKESLLYLKNKLVLSMLIISFRPSEVESRDMDVLRKYFNELHGGFENLNSGNIINLMSCYLPECEALK